MKEYTDVKEMLNQLFSHAEADEMEKNMRQQYERYKNDGWVVMECKQFDSSRFGEIVLLAYGPNNTLQEIPQHPITPRGLSSDISVACAFITSKSLLENDNALRVS